MNKYFARGEARSAFRSPMQRNVSQLMTLDCATVSRKELGRALALNLSQSVHPGATELQEAQNANVNSNLYLNELHFLYGFVIWHTISIASMNAACKNDVLRGYLQFFEEQALESSTAATYFRVFRSRIAAYQEVVKAIQPHNVDPIVLEFAKFLGNSPQSKAYLLAHKYVRVYFLSHVEHTVDALRRAGLFNNTTMKASTETGFQ